MSIPKTAPPLFDQACGPIEGTARRLAASALTTASALLARLAVSVLEPSAAAIGPLPRLEFHAEAGAPEGALYVDGELIGTLRGVQRL